MTAPGYPNQGSDDMEKLLAWLEEHLWFPLVEDARAVYKAARAAFTMDWGLVERVALDYWGTATAMPATTSQLGLVFTSIAFPDEKSSLRPLQDSWTGRSRETFKEELFRIANAISSADGVGVDGGEMQRFPVIGTALKGVADKFAWSWVEFLGGVAAIWSTVEGLVGGAAAIAAGAALGAFIGIAVVLLSALLAGLAIVLPRSQSLNQAAELIAPLATREPNFEEG